VILSFKEGICGHTSFVGHFLAGEGELEFWRFVDIITLYIPRIQLHLLGWDYMILHPTYLTTKFHNL